MYKDILRNLLQKKNLNFSQIAFFIEASERGELLPVQQAAFLTALQAKEVTSSELTHFAKILQKKKTGSVSFPQAIDICGTGGSGLARINTSTIAAFILPALNVPVAKHGNKAASGRFGSFDLLEKLGVNIGASEEQLKLLFQDLHLCFLFARNSHPTFKHFAEVRSSVGFPTIFNLLGPLLNPAETKVQLVGTSFRDKMELIAETAKKIGKKRVMVVRGEDGLDEVTLAGKTQVIELNQGKIKKYTLRPESFGIAPASSNEIRGGDDKANTAMALSILKGECKTRHQDLVLINVALALKLAGKVKNLKKAYTLAKECLESGRGYGQFLRYQRLSHAPSILLQITANKKKEVEKRKQKLSFQKLKKKVVPSIRDFSAAILRGKPSLIAEIKYRSPIGGDFGKNHKSVATIARAYESGGAQAISVLTDERFFGGSLQNLVTSREATTITPLLCKDFIIDEYQIYEARYFGADAILLIAAILTKDQIQHLLEIASELRMATILEIHTEEELKIALATSASIIGINNRDLHSFKVQFQTTKNLLPLIPEDKIIIAESGISSKKDILKLPRRVDAILVGTALMKSPQPAAFIQRLIGTPQPLLKCCGIRSLRDAIFCQENGVDLIGLNFVTKSHRCISYQKAAEIIRTLREQKKSKIRIVGVFQNQKLEEVNSVANMLDLDFIQLSGQENLSYIKKCVKPVIKGISIRRASDFLKMNRFRGSIANFLLDGKTPGSGRTCNHQFLKQTQMPYLMAGGISAENITEIIKTIHPSGIDLATGIETNNQVDQHKIRKILQLLKR